MPEPQLIEWIPWEVRRIFTKQQCDRLIDAMRADEPNISDPALVDGLTKLAQIVSEHDQILRIANGSADLFTGVEPPIPPKIRVKSKGFCFADKHLETKNNLPERGSQDHIGWREESDARQALQRP